LKSDVSKEVIGLIPAAGDATRFGKLPCSKELLPIGFQEDKTISGSKPKVLMSCLLEKMRRASIHNAYVIIKKGKWDIPDYFGDGSEYGINIGYLIQNLPYGVPYTLDQAFPFIMNRKVALGFPDTIYQCPNIYGLLLNRLNKGDAHIVLGVFPADETENADRVEIDTNGLIRRIICKPNKSNLRFVWAAAVWQPGFTHYMHEYLASLDTSGLQAEIQIGHIVQFSIEAGFLVAGVQVSKYPPMDVGNARRLKSLWTMHEKDYHKMTT
jgi:glucose-1-phosphate thymidylyltransferase